MVFRNRLILSGDTVLVTVNEKAMKRNIEDYFAKSTKKQKLNSDENDDSESTKEDAIKEKLQLLQQKGKASTASSNIADKSKTPMQTSSSSREAGWYNHDNSLLIYETENLKHSSKIVAFDMDGTLITTKSGKTFAQDCEDWKILYREIPKKLEQLQKEDFKLVIITNQLGIAKGKVKEEDLQKKVENVVKTLGVPFQVIAIKARGKYRKPNIGTWKWLNAEGNGGVDIREFTYVGDAAGRPKNWAPGKKKDFSCSDRLFALNLNAPFHTPEEYFLSHKPAKFDLPKFDPKSIKDLPLPDDITSNGQELILMVGYPASGKSTFARTHLVSKGYVIINRDTLKTWQKCVAACDKALASKKSVVIDNTNPDKESRQRYLALAKKYNCPCRCFVMNVPIEHAMHNNKFRELAGSGHAVVPTMVLYTYRKKLEEPNLSEGFSQIVKINFVPDFEDEELKKMYFMYND